MDSDTPNPATDPMLHAVDSRLLITPQDDGSLLVDAYYLMRTSNQIRCWQLDYDATNGTWSHWQSGTAGPLAEMLGAITHNYVEAVAVAIPASPHGCT